MSDVTMYVKEGCPYCAAARKHYADQGTRVEEIDVFKVPGAKDKVLELTGGTPIVPVIIENGTVKKGFGGG